MHCHSSLHPPIHVPAFSFSPKNERKLLKAIALGYLHQIFREVFQHSLLDGQDHLAMESYSMDSKIIQLLIKGIIETEEYTLEGIAFYTRVPFDVIYDAAFGVTNRLSVTPWVKVVELYLKVKPDVSQVLAAKLLAISSQNRNGVLELLNEV